MSKKLKRTREKLVLLEEYPIIVEITADILDVIHTPATKENALPLIEDMKRAYRQFIKENEILPLEQTELPFNEENEEL